ncbi:uncharacterized protein ACN427_009088 isoform 1-T3 [Glossina fuscipes fuscipes]
MLDRRTQIEILGFYVGSVVAVRSSDPHSADKVSRFLGKHMTNFNHKFHDALSRHLRDYPKLWRPKKGPQFSQCEELAEKVTREMQEQVSAKEISSALKRIRDRLLRLEKGLYTSTYGIRKSLDIVEPSRSYGPRLRRRNRGA